jgi:hypothetical protein
MTKRQEEIDYIMKKLDEYKPEYHLPMEFNPETKEVKDKDGKLVFKIECELNKETTHLVGSMIEMYGNIAGFACGLIFLAVNNANLNDEQKDFVSHSISNILSRLHTGEYAKRQIEDYEREVLHI